MDTVVLLVFCAVYAGMVLGRLPGLALDRTGIALLGAVALIAAGRLSPEEAWGAVDVSTLALLFGLMVVSAQFRLGGFYTWLTRRIALARVSEPLLLGGLVAASGALSALLANDIVCLAMAPVLAEGCARRRLDPRPFLLALAASANVGSAATHRQPAEHAHRTGGPSGNRHLLARARPRRRPGDGRDPGDRGGMAVDDRLAALDGKGFDRLALAAGRARA